MTCQVTKEDFLRHQQTCEDCAKEWEGIDQVRFLFRTLPQKEVPPSLVESVRQIAYSKNQVFSGTFVSSIIHYFKSFQFQLRLAPALVGVLLFFSVFTVLKSEQSFKNHQVIAEKVQISPELPLNHSFTEESFELSSWINPTISPEGLTGLPTAPPPLTLSDLQKRFEERKTQLMEVDADMLLMRGRRAKAMGRIDLALQDFETIYRFYPDYTYMGDVLMYRAQCYAFKERYQEAIDSLITYQSFYPSKKELIEPMILQLKKAAEEE